MLRCYIKRSGSKAALDQLWQWRTGGGRGSTWTSRPSLSSSSSSCSSSTTSATTTSPELAAVAGETEVQLEGEQLTFRRSGRVAPPPPPPPHLDTYTSHCRATAQSSTGSPSQPSSSMSDSVVEQVGEVEVAAVAEEVADVKLEVVAAKEDVVEEKEESAAVIESTEETTDQETTQEATEEAVKESTDEEAVEERETGEEEAAAEEAAKEATEAVEEERETEVEVEEPAAE